MTPNEIGFVQKSFRMILPIADLAGELFYRRLFELDPSLRQLFASDVKEQGKKLIHMLAIVTSRLEDLDGVLPMVRELGERHVGYGVKEAHYVVVGEALLWMLARCLDDAFTREVRAAWVKTYEIVAGVMQDAARGQQKEQASQ